MLNKTKSLNIKYLAGIFILSFTFNLFWILLIKTQPFSDFLYYHNLARQIANGGLWGDTYTTVGYSVFIALFYKIFGANIIIAKILNLILSLINGLLVFSILNRLSLSRRIKTAILVFYLFFPMNIYYNSVLATEILFTTLLLLITYIYLADIHYKYWIIGILTALNTMIKPFFILFFLVILLTEMLTQEKFLNSLKKGLVVLGMTILIISPWLYRNYKLIGEFTYVSNNGGIVLYINNNSQNHLGRWMPADQIENSITKQAQYQNSNPTQKNKMLTSAAKQWIKSHPKEFLILGMKRLGQTYFPVGDDLEFPLYGTNIPLTRNSLLLNIVALIQIPIFLLGISSIIAFSFSIIRRKIGHPIKNADLSSVKNDVFLLLIFFMFTGVYFITEGQSRYSFPLIFIIIYYFFKGLSHLSISRCSDSLPKRKS